jgi:hypothetical protein
MTEGVSFWDICREIDRPSPFCASPASERHNLATSTLETLGGWRMAGRKSAN